MTQTPPIAAKDTAFLLVNLGSPASLARQDVKRWLGEFLMDPKVIEIPWVARKLLVSGIILPFRTSRTKEAYSAIWTDQGSPLLLNTDKLAKAMERRSGLPVAWAMRYGQPNIPGVMRRLAEQKIKKLVLVPLYPQYASSTTATVLEQAGRVNRTLDAPFEMVHLPPFYHHPSYLECLAKLIRPGWDEKSHLLFSYHGLPERAVKRAHPENKRHCSMDDQCCRTPAKAHAYCYRHQSLLTSQKVAEQLGLTPDQWQVSFQSRLGRAPWLRPYTDEVLARLPGEGIRHLTVICPSFVADNLETLEEINIRGRRLFLQAGGDNFNYIPCLNEDESWVELLSQMCLKLCSTQ